MHMETHNHNMHRSRNFDSGTVHISFSENHPTAESVSGNPLPRRKERFSETRRRIKRISSFAVFSISRIQQIIKQAAVLSDCGLTHPERDTASRPPV